MLLYSRFNQYMYNSVPVEDTLWSNSINNVLNHAVVDLYHAVLSFYNPAAFIHNNTYETGHITWQWSSGMSKETPTDNPWSWYTI